jgi:hypothetical protein
MATPNKPASPAADPISGAGTKTRKPRAPKGPQPYVVSDGTVTKMGKAYSAEAAQAAAFGHITVSIASHELIAKMAADGVKFEDWTNPQPAAQSDR